MWWTFWAGKKDDGCVSWELRRGGGRRIEQGIFKNAKESEAKDDWIKQPDSNVEAVDEMM